MNMQLLLWALVALLVLAILISATTKIHIGIVGFAFAYIYGVFILGGTTKTVAQAFPSSLFLQMLFIPAFFFFPTQNKTLPTLSQNILYAFRKTPVLIPWAFLLIGMILGLGGAGGPVGNLVLTVMCFSIGLGMGLSPWLLALICVYGGNLGTWVPWAGNGLNAMRVTQQWIEHGLPADVPERIVWIMFANWVVLTLIMFVALWLLTKAYRVKAVSMEKPEPLNKTQKLTLTLIIVYILLLLVPAILKSFIKSPFVSQLSTWCQPETVAVLGILLQLFLKLGDSKDMIKSGLSYGPAMAMAGVCTLLNIAANNGITDYLGSVLSSAIAPFWMPLILCLMGGFLSCFAGAMSTVFPLLTAVAVPYAVATGCDVIPLLSGVMLGASASAISPMSSGGAIMIAAIPDETVRESMFYKNLVLAGVGILVACFVCMVFTPIIA